MMDYYYELNTRFSCEESLAALETDIQHANILAASIPRAKNGPYFQMKLVRPEGKRKSSSLGRKATIQEFYSVILPSLQRLHSDSTGHDAIWEASQCSEGVSIKKLDDRKRLIDKDFNREDECGICLEPCTKMVVPSCCHSMCINCYRDWNTRSESCPFCRGSLKRVNSSDLWVLPCSSDRVDTKTVLKEDTLRFLLYINDLPKDIPDALFLMYYEYLI